jgi:hypothetical protein
MGILKKLTAIAKGDLTKDQVLEVLSQMGVEVDFEDVKGPVRPAFDTAATAAAERNSKLTLIRGTARGTKFTGLLVISAQEENTLDMISL